MQHPVDIDTGHSRAIVREIGERLRSSLKEDRELPESFKMQIERLRQSEDEALVGTRPDNQSGANSTDDARYESQKPTLPSMSGPQNSESSGASPAPAVRGTTAELLRCLVSKQGGTQSWIANM